METQQHDDGRTADNAGIRAICDLYFSAFGDGGGSQKTATVDDD